jgi:hypothetical protein
LHRAAASGRLSPYKVRNREQDCGRCPGRKGKRTDGQAEDRRELDIRGHQDEHFHDRALMARYGTRRERIAPSIVLGLRIGRLTPNDRAQRLPPD